MQAERQQVLAYAPGLCPSRSPWFQVSAWPSLAGWDGHLWEQTSGQSFLLFKKKKKIFENKTKDKG